VYANPLESRISSLLSSLFFVALGHVTAVYAERLFVCSFVFFPSSPYRLAILSRKI
jgi:hypothetical protein